MCLFPINKMNRARPEAWQVISMSYGFVVVVIKKDIEIKSYQKKYIVYWSVNNSCS